MCEEKIIMENAIEMLLEGYKDIVIYGAGGVAKEVCQLIDEYCMDRTLSVAVTNIKNNPSILEGIKVYSAESLLNDSYKREALFIVAMMPSSAEGVKGELIHEGCQNVVTADEIAEKMYREFYKTPVQKGKIVFSSFEGKGYGCNPKYICEEILRRKLNIVDCVWTDNGGGERFRREIRTVRYGSYDYYYELATAHVWVDNQHKNILSRKREDQFYVQTWHGNGPLKKIEYDAPQLPVSYLELSAYDMNMVDLCLSGTEFNSMLYKRAFRYNKDILECGCPRNDIFFQKDFDVDRVKMAIGIPNGAAVILYAPTMRDGESNLINAQYILQACKRLYSKYCIMLIREHPRMEEKTGRYVFTDEVINVSDYSDVQEILKIADMVITDYSSLMWDFSLQRKPVFLYHPDVDLYREERGIYLSFSEMPYQEAFSMEDLYEKICNFDDKVYQQQLKVFFERFHPFDNGMASKIVTDRILEVLEIQ